MTVARWSSRSCRRPSRVRPSIRGMLMSRQHHVDAGVALQRGQRVHAVFGEGEAERPIADLPAEALDDQQLQVRLVIDDENARGHPLPLASATTRGDVLLQLREIHRLGHELAGATLQRRLHPFGVAIGGDHEYRQVGPPLLHLRQQVEPAHAGHVDVGDQQDDLLADAAVELVQRRLAGQGEVEQVKPLAHLAAELLAEQHLDIRFVVDHQHSDGHAGLPRSPPSCAAG